MKTNYQRSLGRDYLTGYCHQLRAVLRKEVRKLRKKQEQEQAAQKESK